MGFHEISVRARRPARGRNIWKSAVRRFFVQLILFDLFVNWCEPEPFFESESHANRSRREPEDVAPTEPNRTAAILSEGKGKLSVG